MEEFRNEFSRKKLTQIILLLSPILLISLIPLVYFDGFIATNDIIDKVTFEKYFNHFIKPTIFYLLVATILLSLIPIFLCIRIKNHKIQIQENEVIQILSRNNCKKISYIDINEIKYKKKKMEMLNI